MLRKCRKRRYLGTRPSESGKHALGHSEINESFATGVSALKIAGEPTITRKPGKSSFDDPSFGEHMKTFEDNRIPVNFCSFWYPDYSNACPSMFDDLQSNAKVFFDPLFEWIARIAAIRPNSLKTRQFCLQSTEQHLAPFTIRDISGKHFDCSHQS